MENYEKLFPALRPPYGVESTGGRKNDPHIEYPPDEWWPDLTKPISPIIEVSADGVKENPEFGTYGGTVTAENAENLTINCAEGKINGILLRGVEYEISGADIKMSGCGEDDFGGIGAGLMLADSAKLNINDSRIETWGAGKSCFLNTKSSELTARGCEFICHGGPLPEGYVTVVGPGMLEPPPGLGVGGTARATLTTDHSKSYFYDCMVEADGWAGLSTDAALGYMYLEANNCDVKVHGDGYGVYSDGDCHVFINGGTMTSGNYIAILANQAELTMNNVTGDAGGCGILAHNVLGYNTELVDLNIHGGQYTSRGDFLLLRGTNSYIQITGADITSATGVLVHAILNQDTDATPVKGDTIYGNNLAFADMRLDGDILNDDHERTMSVAMESCAFTGAARDIFLTMDKASSWNVTANSRVVLMGDIRPDQISGYGTVSIEAYAGEGCALEGEYKLRGGAVLKVKALA